MSVLRSPETASERSYDLIVVGGGIYGAMLALESSLRELSVLVLEKGDFGGATTFNSLRTIHGGLRHLQTLDIKSYRELAGEQRWFLEYFPDLVKPLPVLMPLYQRGLRRIGTFRAAFLLGRLLSPQRNRGIPAESVLPGGEILSAPEVKQRFPAVDACRLRGGALWYDACVPDSQRLIMEVLHGACRMGATFLNYMPAVDLLKEQNRVVGVCARDALNDARYDFFSKVVINATGPWSRETTRRFDRDIPDLFRPSIAWNVLFDREALSDCALAVSPPASGGRTYFLHPWKGRLLAGTGHAPRAALQEVPRPSPEELSGFLNDLNEAIPGLNLDHREILHVFAGYLPVEKDGTIRLTKKARFVDHAKHDGPSGLFSISGTRFTAARRVAEKGVLRVFPDCAVPPGMKARFRKARTERAAASRVFYDYERSDGSESSGREYLLQLIQTEAVCHLDDLVLRRTSLGDHPTRSLGKAHELCKLFDWDNQRCREEILRIYDHFYFQFQH